MRLYRFILLLALLVGFMSPVRAQGEVHSTDQRVELIYRFSQEIKWPDLAAQSNFYIRILGRDPEFYNALSTFLKGKEVSGKPILLSYSQDFQQWDEHLRPHIFYVTESGHHFLPEVVEHYEGHPVLIISSRPFFERGWMVSLNRVATRGALLESSEAPRNWVFSINRGNIERRAHLSVSSELLRSAQRVEDTPSPRAASGSSSRPNPNQPQARTIESELIYVRNQLEIKDNAIILQVETIRNLKDTVLQQQRTIDSLTNIAYFHFSTASEFLDAYHRLRTPLALYDSGTQNMLPISGRGFEPVQVSPPQIGKPGDTAPWRYPLQGWLYFSLALAVGVACYVGVKTSWSFSNLIKGEKGRAEAQENAMKSAFFANLSHELRTPLNAITGLSQYVVTTSSEDEEIKENLEVINASAQSLMRMMDSIITKSMLDAGALPHKESMVNLPDFFDRLLLESSQLLEQMDKAKRVTIRTNLSEQLPTTVLLDIDKVDTILGALLSNAVRYTAAGEVVFGCIPQYGEDAKKLLFFVEDTGEGMTPAQVERIYDAASSGTTPPRSDQAQGMGLGLTVAQGLAKILGTTLHITSAVNLGTRVEFSLDLRIPPQG